MRLLIFDIPIDLVSLNQAQAKIEQFLNSFEAHLIITPNPEMLVAARHDPELKRILQKADLAIADGFGLKIAAWINHGQNLEKITGTDFMESIIEQASGKSNIKIALVGGKHDEAVKTRAYFLKLFPQLSIISCPGGELQIKKGRYTINQEDFLQLQKFDPQIIFAAFGHGQQEKWLDQNLEQFPNLKIAMGVGGAFNFYAGYLKRAPKLMRRLGLEWLYRLIQEPQRIGRIWNAVGVFLCLIIKDKIAKMIKVL